MRVIAWLDFELVCCIVTIHQVSNYTTSTPLSILNNEKVDFYYSVDERLIVFKVLLFSYMQVIQLKVVLVSYMQVDMIYATRSTNGNQLEN